MFKKIVFLIIILSFIFLPKIQAESPRGDELLIEDFEEEGFAWIHIDFNSGKGGETSFVPKEESTVHDGSSSARIDYNFATEDNDFIEVYKFKELPAVPESIGMWVYGNKSGNRLFYRIADSYGEVFQVKLGDLNWEGWKYIKAPVDKFEVFWGGNSDGMMDLPVKFGVIAIDDYPDNKVEKGTIYIDQIKAYYKEPLIPQPRPLQLKTKRVKTVISPIEK